MIPSSSSRRLPSNIPLQTLSGRTSQSGASEQTASLLGVPGRRRGHPADSPRSSGESTDSGLDTGDVAEQVNNTEDPLRVRLQDILNYDLPVGVVKQSGKGWRLRSRKSAGVVSKEAIVVPETVVRHRSLSDRVFAVIMPGHSGSHGLTSKALVY
jgi:hypothetical protein